MCGRIKSFVVQLASIPTHIPKTWHSTLYPYSYSHLTSTIHSPFSPMLLYFPLSPSSTIHFLLCFNSNFLVMNYESSIDRKKKDLLQIFLLFDMYLSRSCKHVGIIVVGLFWLNFVKSLSLFFLINLRIAKLGLLGCFVFSFGSN